MAAPKNLSAGQVQHPIHCKTAHRPYLRHRCAAAPPVLEPAAAGQRTGFDAVAIGRLSAPAHCQGFTQMSMICSSQQCVARSTSRSCPRGFPSPL